MSNYKVGYGKPPKENQWQVGQSGNPKGRPKKKRNHLFDAYYIVTEPVRTNSSNPNDAELTPLQAGLLKTCQEALQGKRKALLDILKRALDHLDRINRVRSERKHQEDPKLKLARMMGLNVVNGVICFSEEEEEAAKNHGPPPPSRVVEARDY